MRSLRMKLLKANISTDSYTVRQVIGAKAKEEPDLEEQDIFVL